MNNRKRTIEKYLEKKIRNSKHDYRKTSYFILRKYVKTERAKRRYCLNSLYGLEWNRLFGNRGNYYGKN